MAIDRLSARLGAAFAGLTLIALTWSIAPARAELDQNDALDLTEQGKILPLEEIIAQARHFHQGKLIEAMLEYHAPHYVYRLEILDEHGQVWDVLFDAASGERITTE
ncbi:PepSY domain-containing protein [Halotalea alkalilenta]|uniref:PepSY domain-containing protein n=1 Tax=Halotalea alkalilenta TaxID=376489 RepID=UPI0009DD05CD|nr:PepSY domain-containing protein [Halotalea alkalilenta]